MKIDREEGAKSGRRLRYEEDHMGDVVAGRCGCYKDIVMCETWVVK